MAEEVAADEAAPAATTAAGGGALTAGKKKRKNKSVASRGPGALNKKCGTGFEEYFADPPITPDEYQQERKLYDPDLPLEERMEECLRRFRARRRLDSSRALIFTRYLMLGGIDATARQFQGGSNLRKGDLDGDETVADIQRNDMLDSRDPRFYSPDTAEHWEVDFTSVVKGFLSEQLLKAVGYDIDMVLVGVELLRNFLNYLITHDVCPEHNEDIKAARSVCELANFELPDVISVTCLLPGSFNSAACALYPVKDPDASVFDNSAVRTIDAESEKRVFMATIATSEQLTSMVTGPEAVRCTGSYEETYEVKELHFPANELNDFHAGVVTTGEDGKTGTTPCGYVTLVPTTIQDGWDNERPRAKESLDEEAFFLEVYIMKKLRPGMKMRLVVGVLSPGLRIIREVREVYASFYTFLPQELMLDYREPVPNDRPAPSIHDDPNAEEADLDGMMDKNLN